MFDEIKAYLYENLKTLVSDEYRTCIALSVTPLVEKEIKDHMDGICTDENIRCALSRVLMTVFDLWL